MTRFEEELNFVKYILAGATNAQLEFSGMTTKGRDAVLEKPIDIYFFPTTKQKDRETIGQFDSFKSYIENKSVIGCSKHQEEFGSRATLCEIAAHEIFHAARFWTRNHYLQKIMCNKKETLLTGAAIVATGGLFGPVVALSTLYTLFAGVFTEDEISSRKMYQEEKQAYRFGYLFNADAYIKNNFYCYNNKKQSYIDYLTNNYPTENEKVYIFNETCRECVSGNPLFPLGEDGYNKKYNEFLSECGKAPYQKFIFKGCS